MSQVFLDPILAGTVLVRGAIQSANYVPGQTGWIEKQDGSAEFNNVTVRGVIESGQFIGTGTGDEILIYSGTPAANNLIASVTSTASTDAEGNSVPGGFTTYAKILGVYYAVVTSGTEVFLFSGASQATWTTQQGYIEFLASPQATGFILPLLLFSGAAPAGSAAGALIYANANGTAAAVLPSGLAGTMPLDQTDTSTKTNSNNGTQPLTVAWTINAGDASAGTMYEIEVPFSGTFENQTLGFKPALNGSTVTTSGGDMIGGAFFTTGTGFAGTVRLKLQITATGSPGTANLFIDGGVGANSSRSSGTNNNDAYLSSQATAVAFDTTVSNTLEIETVWGGSTAGQTVSGRGSKFTRSGP